MLKKLSFLLAAIMLLCACSDNTDPNVIASINGRNITKENFEEQKAYFAAFAEHLPEYIKLYSDGSAEWDAEKIENIYNMTDDELLKNMLAAEYIKSQSDLEIDEDEYYDSARQSYEIMMDDKYNDETQFYRDWLEGLLADLNWTQEDYIEYTAKILMNQSHRNRVKVKFGIEYHITDEETLEQQFSEYIEKEVEKNAVIY